MQTTFLRYEAPTYLVEYGICTEQSDYRLHVGFAIGTIWIFPTRNGCDAVKRARLIGIKPELPHDHAVKDALATAMGYLIYPCQIEACRDIPMPTDLLAWKPPADAGTSVKGRAAEQVANEMMSRGLIALPVIPHAVTDTAQQKKGHDIIATSSGIIQVKCDYWAGYNRKGRGERGLFLQTHERNTLHQY